MAKRIRIQADDRATVAGANLIDYASSNTANFFRGEAVSLEIAMINAGVFLLSGDITTSNLKIYDSDGTTLLVDETILPAALNSAFTAEQWRNGTSHLMEVLIPAAKTEEFTAGMCDVLLTATTSAGQSVYIEGRISVRQTTGLTAVTPTTPAPPAAYTTAEVDALIAEIGQLEDGIYRIEANASPTTDMRAAIQAGLDSGAGIVELGVGTFRVTTVYSAPGTNKAEGAYGLEIPTGVTLRGQGWQTIVEIHGYGGAVTGVGIAPAGFRTASTDYGAAHDVTLQDFKLLASSQIESSGNLLNIVHARNWTMINLWIAGSYYHGTEIDQSDNIRFFRCRYSGSYSSTTTGTTIQLDNGNAGPRSTAPTGNLVSNLLWEDCIFEARPDTDVGQRDIELCHNSNMAVDGVTFRGCKFYARAIDAYVSVIDANTANDPEYIKNFTVENCEFHLPHYKAIGILIDQQSGCLLRSIHIRNNKFIGRSAAFIRVGSGTSITYNATQADRIDCRIEDNVFVWTPETWVGGADFHFVIANAWHSLRIRRNNFICEGNMPGSGGLNYCDMIRTAQNFSVDVSENVISWNGTPPSITGKAGIYVDQTLTDAAGTTLAVAMRDNVVSVTGGTFEYGVTLFRGTTSPDISANVFSGNVGVGMGAAYNGARVGGQGSGSMRESGLALPVRSVTGATTATQQDGVIRCNATSGAFAVTLPDYRWRRAFIIEKTDASGNAITVGTVTLTSQYSSCLVTSDGAANYVTKLS